jgi:hypothetical protein
MKKPPTARSAEAKGRELAGSVSATETKDGGRKVDGAANARGRKLAQDISTRSVERAPRTRR